MEQEKQLHWFPGHMMKAMRAIEAKLPIIDVVIEIIDARAPNASRSLTLENLIKNKTRIIVLNKVDLADQAITKLWVNFFENQNLQVLLTKSVATKIKPQLISAVNLAIGDKIQKLKNKGIKNPHIKVLVLGLPNVGKSTFINNVIEKKVAKAADSPGVTRGQQWIKLNSVIDLLDSPGILPPKVDEEKTKLILSLIKCLPSKHLFLEEIAIFTLKFLVNNYPTNLEKRYQMSMPTDTNNQQLVNYFHLLAQKYHFKINNNEDNIHRAMNLLIHDLQQGKLGLISFERPNN